MALISLIIIFTCGCAAVCGFTSPSSINITSKMMKWANTDFVASKKIYLLTDNHVVASFASKLYPASMICTLGELYFLSRKEMECPSGAVSCTSIWNK